MAQKTIYEEMKESGVSRRQFIKTCGLIAASMGIPFSSTKVMGVEKEPSASVTKAVANALKAKPRVPVIWIQMQGCTGCTESVSRSLSPTLKNLVLNSISLDYHETLSAAAGHQIEANREDVIKKYNGKYILVAEGGVPTADDGVYCVIAGKTAIDILKEAAAGAAAVISIGTCASFGGVPKARPNPTKAIPVSRLLKDRTVVNIPGCPPVPEVFTGTVASFLVFGKLPELDDLNRPRVFFENLHDRCLRRPFYEAGKFAVTFDDEGARKGYCLYKLGCKGPTTSNACATIKWNGGLSFPMQSNHPCLGCSQPDFWDGGGFYQGQSAPLSRPGAAAVGTAIAAGALIGAGIAASNHSKKKHLHKGIGE